MEDLLKVSLLKERRLDFRAIHNQLIHIISGFHIEITHSFKDNTYEEIHSQYGFQVVWLDHRLSEPHSSL